MSLSEVPPPVAESPGSDLPDVRTRPPGPASRSWQLRLSERQVPMGPRRAPVSGDGLRPAGPIVLGTGLGSNVFDVDMNRYVDLAAGFGALLLGHCHPNIVRALQIQASRLFQGMGDLYPSDAKIGLLERLAQISPIPEAQLILGQSGADAIGAALKTATLVTGRPGVVAFHGSYHGLSYGPLAALDLRPSYRAPFEAQLSPHVRFAPYPSNPSELDASLAAVRLALSSGDASAILVEPLLGRGGVVEPPAGFLSGLAELAREFSALLVFDEIWTGLGRIGDWFVCSKEGVVPDLLCVGKGLGGGLPISACIGRREIMTHWSRDEEVVDSSTFAGAPLACTTALATIDVLSRQRLVFRAREVGDAWKARLVEKLAGSAIVEVRGRGFMLGLDASKVPGGASALARALLERGYLTSTGGGKRDVLVLTPPLIVPERLLDGFDDALVGALRALGSL